MHDLDLGLEGFAGELPIFPLPEVVLFPCTLLPLHIFEPRYRQMVLDAAEGSGLIGMAKLKPGWQPEYHGCPDVHPVACLGKMVNMTPLADGRFHIVLCGARRARIKGFVRDDPYRIAHVELLDDDGIGEREHEAHHLRELLVRRVEALPSAYLKHERVVPALKELEAPLGCLADLVADAVDLGATTKQSLLEELDPVTRARLLIEVIGEELEDLFRPAPYRSGLPRLSRN